MKNNVRKDFTIIPNALINDDERSDRARFLFIYMASKPDDWDFYQEPLAKSLGYSVDTLRKYISELMDAGWMTREERRDEGKFDSYDYTLLPSPCGKNTDTVKYRHGKKPERGNSELYNKDYYKERLDTKKERERAPENSKTETTKQPTQSPPPHSAPPPSPENFFTPDKHERAADEVIRYLEGNKMYLNGMEKGDWKRAVKGHCLKLQKDGKWNDLTIPITEQQYFSWIGRRIAGVKSWFTAAAEIDKQSGRQPDALTIKAPPNKKPQPQTRRASADEARKIAGL